MTYSNERVDVEGRYDGKQGYCYVDSARLKFNMVVLKSGRIIVNYKHDTEWGDINQKQIKEVHEAMNHYVQLWAHGRRDVAKRVEAV